MPFPANPMHIVDPHARSNPHPTWQNFSRYCWFRLRGFKEALVELQQHAQQPVTCDTIKQYRAAGIQAVPPALQALFVANSEWRELSAPQVDKADAGDPMRFDKACMTVAALDRCAAQLAPNWNALATVTICPATFILDGFDTARWQNIQALGPVGGQPFVEALKQHTTQRNIGFFTELAKGYAATQRTVSLTLDFLRQHGQANGLSVVELTDRYDDRQTRPKPYRRSKQPNNLETVVV